MKRYIRSSYNDDAEFSKYIQDHPFESMFHAKTVGKKPSEEALRYADYISSIAALASKSFSDKNRIVHEGYSDSDTRKINFKMLGSRFSSATIRLRSEDVLDVPRFKAVENVVAAFEQLIESGQNSDGFEVTWQPGRNPSL